MEFKQKLKGNGGRDLITKSSTFQKKEMSAQLSSLRPLTVA